MRQVVQATGSGELRVVEVPVPVIGPAEVLVAAEASLLSPGTERAVRALARSSLVGKARARPDLVRQVVAKARAEGVATTARSVRARLDEEMPLGYSAAGRVIEVGDAVVGVRPGDLVATGGAGHADYQVVMGHLAVPAPGGVPAEDAAFATVAAIALHGLRQGGVDAGARICVIGLGLVGQLTARLALAAGMEVAGIDLRPWTADLVTAAGGLGLVEAGAETTGAVLDWSRGRGADAVVIAAATPSPVPLQRSPELARDRATVVVVGDVGIELDRTPFYERELTLRFARSYGPGRYERAYEEWGIDLPPAHVRWSEGRNLEAVLDLMASGRLSVADLVTHRYPIIAAADAYRLLASDERYLAVQLTYDNRSPPERREVIVARPRRVGGHRVGLLGAGNYARSTLVPALRSAGFDRITWVASASGRTARHLAERVGAERATSDAQAVIGDADVDLVVIATPHDTHADLTEAALAAGRHVFCEKPLALTADDLDRVERAWRANPGQLMVGFNRRHSRAVAEARAMLGDKGGPLVITYRVNAESLSPRHWYHDRRQGGRLLGEVCHFVDTCAALVGASPDLVWATGSGAAEALLADHLAVVLRYPDGSVASITYASSGHPSMAKERVEVLGRGHAVIIDDYRSVIVDGTTNRARHQDKGHATQLERLRSAIAGEGPAGTEDALATMRTIFACAESLLGGQAVPGPGSTGSVDQREERRSQPPSQG